MERMGPRGGDPVALGLVMAGQSAAEVDWVGCQVMGHSLDDVGHLRLFVEASGVDLGAIETVGESIERVRRPFKKAALTNALPAAFRLHQHDACSACMNALLLSCQLLEEEPQGPIDVFVGTRLQDEPRREALGLAFGNCVPAEAECRLRIKGCPPYPFALKKVLADHVSRP